MAQVWRNGSRQARLARLLHGLAEIEFGRERARRVGLLLGLAGVRDVGNVAAGSIVEASADGDEILTSDPDDIETLAMASGKTLIVTRI